MQGERMEMKRTKKINRALIMREIWLQRETSRIEIARRLSLDKSTISNAVNELIEAGIIIETEEGSSGPQGGRKPKYITLNNAYGCVLGIEFTPEACTAVAVDLNGDIVYSHVQNIHLQKGQLTEMMVANIGKSVDDVKRLGQNLLGIGVGVSGVVNGEDSIIMYSTRLGISSDYDFYEEVASKFTVPVFVDNDANACVWGELAIHRERQLRDFIFLLLEFRDYDPQRDETCNRISVGIGFVINGSVHYGHHYSAGEFRSLYRTTESTGQFSLTEAEQQRIFSDWAVMEKWLTELSSHVGLIVNTLNLSHIILGGAFEELGDEVKDIMEREIRKNWPYPYEYTVRENILYSSFGKKAVAYGAAGMVLNTLFGEAEVMEGLSRRRNLQHGIVVFS